MIDICAASASQGLTVTLIPKDASNQVVLAYARVECHMPTKSANIEDAFTDSNCTELFCVMEGVRLGKSAVTRLRDSFSAKRQKWPLRFAGRIGDHKKIGVFSQIDRVEENFRLFVRWFPASEDPPPEWAKHSEFFEIADKAVGETEAFVSAKFSYDRQKVSSIFTPIQLGSETTIFDEIVGFTGVKRTPDGKMLYMLEASLEAKRIGHVVRFYQALRLSEELPLMLLDIAVRISSLGLKKHD